MKRGNTMLKKVTSLFLSFVMVFSVFSIIPITANAEEILNSGQCGDNVYYTLYVDHTLVISGTGDMYNYTDDDKMLADNYGYVGSVEIKSGVTSIGDYAFYDCFGLKSVTIPNSVRSIGNGAFSLCINLESLTIPYGVTSIGAAAFGNCAWLTSITIPDSVVSIGDGAFRFCTMLKSITIPNSVRSIGDSAFYYCTDITSIAIPYGVTSIGFSTFEGCESLTSVTLPNSVTSIGVCAFMGCTNLTSINIPNGVTSIGFSAFVSCTSLTSITIPESVTSIEKLALSNCRALEAIDVDLNNSAYCSVDGVLFDKKVENLILYPISKKGSNYTIPNGVKRISEYAFATRYSLINITIPDSVKTIDNSAFRNCSNLTDVYYTGTEDQWKLINIGDTENQSLLNATIHYNLSYILGDVNNDNMVNVMDATEIQKYLAGLIILTDAQKAKGDVNNDGVLNVVDATEIQKYLAGVSSYFGNL